MPTKFLISLLFLVLFNACSSENTGLRFDSSVPVFPGEDITKDRNQIERAKLPWELWGWGKTLDGRPLRSSSLLMGDELAREGALRQALPHYQRAMKELRDPEEKKALMVRLAGTYLALDQASLSLKTLSEFFKTNKIPVSDVNEVFALLFAYSYGRLDNVDQSLAWFSQAEKIGRNSRLAKNSATEGVSLLLRAMPSARFNELDRNWSVDLFVNPLIAQERARRARSGFNEPNSFALGRFWESGSLAPAPFLKADSLDHSGGKAKVGILLPLSGRFSGFGNNLRNGMELVFESERSFGQDTRLEFVYRDSGSELEQAIGATTELISQEGVSMIIGPLISDSASTVSDIARRGHVPLLAFSKSANFVTGDGIFRLGPTTESQVRSLVEDCESKLNLKNFALIYPDDFGGHEFAQSFKTELHNRGLSLRLERSYPKGDLSALMPLASELDASSEIEAVFLPDGLQAVSQFVGYLSSDARSRIKLLGTASWDNPTELANSRALLSGAIFISPFFSESSRPIVASFVESYRQKYGKKPDFFAAQGFDAASMVVAAMRRHASEGLSPEQAFSEIEEYAGLTGSIRVNRSGDLDRKFTVIEVHPEGLSELIPAETPLFVDRGNLTYGPEHQN